MRYHSVLFALLALAVCFSVVEARSRGTVGFMLFYVMSRKESLGSRKESSLILKLMAKRSVELLWACLDLYWFSL